MGRQPAQMRDPAFLVLVSLQDGPLDGCAIIQLVAELSGGRVRLATGTLYAALDRLAAEDQVNLVREEVVHGRVRRSYGLTSRGASAAEAEAERMADAARLVTEPPPEGEHRSPEGEPRVSDAAEQWLGQPVDDPGAEPGADLERRCRWLLLAYPAWYLRERGGEMLGTLLETSPPGGRWPSFRETRALILGGLRVRGWVWRLSMLWVVLGAGGALYGFACATVGCTTRLCAGEEFWFLLWNGEPGVIADVGVLAAVVWLLLAVPLLVAGFVRLRGWQPRNWRPAAAWAGAWVAGSALMVVAVVVAANGSNFPGVGWGELPVFAAWVALGAVMNQMLSTPAHSRDVPESRGRPRIQTSR